MNSWKGVCFAHSLRSRFFTGTDDWFPWHTQTKPNFEDKKGRIGLTKSERDNKHHCQHLVIHSSPFMLLSPLIFTLIMFTTFKRTWTRRWFLMFWLFVAGSTLQSIFPYAICGHMVHLHPSGSTNPVWWKTHSEAANLPRLSTQVNDNLESRLDVA